MLAFAWEPTCVVCCVCSLSKLLLQDSVAQETAQSIDREAREIVDGQYDRVKKLLEEKKEPLTACCADAYGWVA
eukprot:1321062-Amphidinium_carterae.1